MAAQEVNGRQDTGTAVDAQVMPCYMNSSLIQDLYAYENQAQPVYNEMQT